MPPSPGRPLTVYEVWDLGSLPVAPTSFAPGLEPKFSFHLPTEKPCDVQVKVSVAPLNVEPGSGLTISGHMTVTVWVAAPVLPAASVALQVTVVMPTVKGPVMSGAGVSEPSASSIALAVPSSTSVSAPVARTVTSAGGVTTGGVVSNTVMGTAVTLLVSSPSAMVLPESPSIRKYHAPGTVAAGIPNAAAN